MRGAVWWREQHAIEGLPLPPRGSANVVLLILDTVRAAELSFYGYSRPTTPELQRWAHRGVTFRHAIAPASWTLPSHASIFTGHLPVELSTSWWDPLDRRYPTLAEHPAGAGYLTAGSWPTSSTPVRRPDWGCGFARYEGYPISVGQLALSSGILRRLQASHAVRRLVGTEQRLNRKPASQINRAFLEWLDRTDGRPFFAFLNYFDAHTPYYPPPPFASRFTTPGIMLNPALDQVTPQRVGRLFGRRDPGCTERLRRLHRLPGCPGRRPSRGT